MDIDLDTARSYWMSGRTRTESSTPLRWSVPARGMRYAAVTWPAGPSTATALASPATSGAAHAPAVHPCMPLPVGFALGELGPRNERSRFDIHRRPGDGHHDQGGLRRRPPGEHVNPHLRSMRSCSLTRWFKMMSSLRRHNSCSRGWRPSRGSGRLGGRADPAARYCQCGEVTEPRSTWGYGRHGHGQLLQRR